MRVKSLGLCHTCYMRRRRRAAGVKPARRRPVRTEPLTPEEHAAIYAEMKAALEAVTPREETRGVVTGEGNDQS